MADCIRCGETDRAVAGTVLPPRLTGPAPTTAHVPETAPTPTTAPVLTMAPTSSVSTAM